MSDDAPTIDRDVVLIGCGQMGSALASGLIHSNVLAPERLICLDANQEKADALAEKLGGGTDDARENDEPRVWIAAVKPRDVATALESRLDRILEDDLVISIAAGVTTRTIRKSIGSGPAMVRAMPNTPALVRRGITGLYCSGDRGLDLAKVVFNAVGRVVVLDTESNFDAVTAISGSGPAFVFTALEALADGGVLMGLSRHVARALAVETLRGSAALARAQSDVHTAELKDRVASPGGTTIAGLEELERKGFRDALISAVRAAAERSREMGESHDD